MLEPVDEQLFPYLQSLLDTIILKDVVKRHAIQDLSVLERILFFLFDNCSNQVSARSIADYFTAQKIRVSTDTVISYISHLTSAFLLHKSERFDLKGKRNLEFHHKLYIADHGLRTALFGYRKADIGQLLENCVYIELLRRGYNIKTGIIESREVDFIAEKEGNRIYIQVCYLLQNQSTVEREFGNLERINDNYPKLVLSMDRFFPEERRGIRHRYIPDYLLTNSNTL